MKRSVLAIVSFVFTVILTCSTVFAAGWKRDSIGYKYENEDGTYKKNEWVLDVDGKWYYLGPHEYMLHDQWIDGIYYVDSTGAMVINAITPDGYYVGSDGKYIASKGRVNQGNTANTGSINTAGSNSASGTSSKSSGVSSGRSSGGSGLYYWTDGGHSYHSTPNCRTLKRSKNIHSGTSIPAGKKDPCNVCVR